MNLFDKLQNFKKQISDVENNLITNKKDFLEIYEKNIQLEKEITERKKELDVANQRMLTLQHIWEMMNSAQPLSSVLNTIVKMLQGELGYLHSCIIQKKEDEQGEYLKVITQTKGRISEKLGKIVGKSLESYRLIYDKQSIFAESLKNKKIIQTVDLRKGLKTVVPDFPEDLVQKILNNAQTRSVILVPLHSMNVDFGWLVVFSSRDVAEEAELDFLKLFSHQIELAITIADLFQVVKNQAITDSLTTLYNRRYFEESIDKEFVRAERMKQPFTVIALDLDHLKQINDKYGHSIGDLAITAVSDVLKKNARSIDIAARMGGEEFNLLLPGVDSQGGIIAAERIRQAVEDCDVEEVGKITASIGVATFPEHSGNIEELLELVDQAMYSSKRNGRNKVTPAQVIIETSWQEIAMDTFIEILSKYKKHIPEDASEELQKKINKSKKLEKTSLKDQLYVISDLLAQTYNPNHEKGITKTKIKLATKLATLFDLSEEEINKLRIALLLYDVGNLMLPQELLQKSGPLTNKDKEAIKKHPVIAAREILEPISDVKDVIPIIEHHHENWDGSGYPNKVSGSEIPIASQIILILDAYFALIEPRSYRDAISPKEALEIIEQDSNKKWNPQLVEEFIKIIQKK